MTEVTPRLTRRILRDFPVPGSAPEVTRMVAEVSDSERVQAAIVLWASGDLGRIRDGVELALLDWRNCLVRAGLANEDWSDRLTAALGPETGAPAS